MKAETARISPADRKNAVQYEEPETVSFHDEEPAPGEQGKLFREPDLPAADLDEIAEELERIREETRARRAAEGKTGRPHKSQRERELEAQLKDQEARTKKTAGGRVKYTEPADDQESDFMEADKLTAETVIAIAENAMIALCAWAKHPQLHEVPLKPRERKALEGPLTAWMEEQAIKMTPGTALAVALASIALPRVLPLIVEAIAKQRANPKPRKMKVSRNQ